MKRAKTCFAIITVGLIFSFVNAAAAAPDLDFYKGKTITYIVATKPGGGYDSYARLIGKYMQKYIPDVTVNIKNTPGP
jgi:tripartite-type tricarboxylate transporter receptor subunit TctC